MTSGSAERTSTTTYVWSARAAECARTNVTTVGPRSGRKTMSDARKAAQERYPVEDGWPESWQHLFVEGAKWQAARAPQITDQMVTAAMVAYEGHPTRVEAWRAALEAALGQTNDRPRGIDRSDPQQRAEYLAASHAAHALANPNDTKEGTA